MPTKTTKQRREKRIDIGTISLKEMHKRYLKNICAIQTPLLKPELENPIIVSLPHKETENIKAGLRKAGLQYWCFPTLPPTHQELINKAINEEPSLLAKEFKKKLRKLTK